MDIGVLVENVLLLVGFGAITSGLYFRKKEDYFQSLFKGLEKCQKYQLDYVESMEHLPKDKKIILFGTAKAHHGANIIAKSYITKGT